MDHTEALSNISSLTKIVKFAVLLQSGRHGPVAARTRTEDCGTDMHGIDINLGGKPVDPADDIA